METRKIGGACFFGGVATAAALMFLPLNLKWLGLLAGFASGYLAYEFEQVLHAIVTVWRRELPAMLGSIARCMTDECKAGWDIVMLLGDSCIAWLKQPHPFRYPALTVVVLLFGTTVTSTPSSMWASFYQAQIEHPEHDQFTTAAIPIGLYVLAAWLVMGLCAAAIWGLSEIGLEQSNLFWKFPDHQEDGRRTNEEAWAAKKEAGFQEIPVNYTTVARGVLAGSRYLVVETLKLIPMFIGGCWLGVSTVIKWIPRLIWGIFVLIHSERRLLCGLDGMLGGLVAAWYGWTHPLAPIELVVLVISGGLIGAALGPLNWEIVSKRILRLPVAMSTA